MGGAWWVFVRTANLDFDDLQTKEHPGSRFVAYSRSKLAQVMHAFKLQRLLDGMTARVCMCGGACAVMRVRT